MQRILTLIKALGARAAGFTAGSGGIVDSLLQAFENCRAGLADEAARTGGTAVTAYFTDIYEKERGRIEESVRNQALYLPKRGQAELVERVEDRIRNVLIPAYCRLAGPFALRERNDFYLVPEGWHAAERIGWAVVGTLLGAFVVWAPFIPLWEKEWVLVFLVGGFMWPALRRFFALKRYEGELNRLAVRTEDEITRLDMALMSSAAQDSVADTAEADQDEDDGQAGQAGSGLSRSTGRRSTAKEGR